MYLCIRIYDKNMNKVLARCIWSLLAIFAIACSKQPILDDLEHIKNVGDENPQTALVMLDSLESEIRESNDYIRSKYDLLRIRLNDKADNMPSSDLMIKRLVGYFEDKGSIFEKQEVAYYAGSVYRDLQDTPRSLEFFLKSIEYANTGNGCDSIMLRNAYSNLAYLYYKVQNYNDALIMAQKELEISKQTKTDVIIPYQHIGAAYLALDSSMQAKNAFNLIYEQIKTDKDISKYQNSLVYLLCDYSELGELQRAKECLSLIGINPLVDYSAFACIAFAQYYESLNQNDSAIIYCKRILEDGTDINNMYDATKLLYRICKKTGNRADASHYAEIYMQLSDSLDFGKRQELAATVNNEFQYHLDQKKEQGLKDEKEKYKNTLVMVSLSAILLLSLSYIFYVRRRNKHLQEVVTLSSELQRISNDDKQLRANIAKKEQELIQSKKSLAESTDELANVKRELLRVNVELSEYGEALKDKEQQLAERMDQNKTFIKLLHQSELEGKAEDVIYDIRQSSTGKKNMKPADWKQLYQAVDELYPLFKDRLLKELGTFTEQQMQVCYLMRIGLSKPQIQNITNLSRVTIWRWVKKYDWVMTLDDKAEMAD